MSHKNVNTRRAKTLDEDQIKRAVGYVRQREHGLRNHVILLLSVYGALRSQEIAGLRWDVNLLKSNGQIADSIHITRDLGKWGKERVVPMHPELRVALMNLRRERPNDIYVVYPTSAATTFVDRVSPNAIVQFFKRLYADLGFIGCSSHSGRRTFISVRARQANLAGCSLVDVQKIAGHAKLETTALYIEPSDQQRRLVMMPYETGAAA